MNNQEENDKPDGWAVKYPDGEQEGVRGLEDLFAIVTLGIDYTEMQEGESVLITPIYRDTEAE